MTSSDARRPWQLSGPPRPPASGAPVLAIDDLGQAVGSGHGADDHVAAIAAVAAVRPTLGDVLLAPEAAAARAPVTTLHEKRNSVNEHNDPLGKKLSSPYTFPL